MDKLTNGCIDVVQKFINIFGSKWTLLVVGEIITGKNRFSEIEKILGISPKMLSETLKLLEKEKIVKREVKPTTPVMVEYHLTNKGYELESIILSIRDYTHKWL